MESKINYFIIHCDEHKERKHYLDKIIKNLNQKIQIFKGYFTKKNKIDRKSQEEYLKRIDKNIDLKENFIFSKPGQIGCYLSHHMLIKHLFFKKYNYLFKEYNNTYSVILEDDVIWNIYNIDLHNSILDIINNLKNKNKDWDIIFLGNLSNNHAKPFDKNIYYLDGRIACFGTHALLINNKNLEKIYLQNCFVRNEIDSHYKKLIDNNKLIGFVIYPPLCYQNDNLNSNINE